MAVILISAAGCAGPRSDLPGMVDFDGTPRRYRCFRAGGPLKIDGRLDERAWAGAAQTSDFVDIEGRGPLPPLTTNARMLWDEQRLYVGAWLQDPHVWATLTEHDAVVYHDNDFEVFIDPDGDGRDYFEIEINAYGTIFDLLLERPYRDGGPARHDWDVRDLKAAVLVHGTLNESTDVDQGWNVEMAIPWKALADHSRGAAPPKVGDVWRMNFSRVQWPHRVIDGRYSKVPERREENWVWSPQGEIDMHIPGRWGFVEFRADLAQARDSSQESVGELNADR